MEETKKAELWTNEEIEALGTMADDALLDYSYPEGFFKMANSLDFLPDTATRVQFLKGLLGAMATAL